MKIFRVFELLQSTHAISFDIHQGRTPSHANLRKAGLPESVAERFKR